MSMFDAFRKRKSTEELEPEEEELTLNEKARLSRIRIEREIETPGPPVDEGERMEESEPMPEPIPEPEMSEEEEARARIDSLKLKIEEEKLKEEASQYTKTGQLKSGFMGAAKSMISRSGGKTSTAQGVTKVVRNIATLGGAVHISKARKKYYIPQPRPGFYVPKAIPMTNRPDRSLYDTAGMRKLTAPQTTRMSETYTRTALQKKGIDLSALRTSTQLSIRPRTTPTTPRGDVDLSKFKQAGTLSGSSPIARMAIGSQSPLTKGRRRGIPKNEAIIGEWDGSTIYFWDLSEGKGHNVKGTDVVLTKTANGIYYFRGVSEESLAPVSRMIGKTPPKQGQKFGPMRKKGKGD